MIIRKVGLAGLALSLTVAVAACSSSHKHAIGSGSSTTSVPASTVAPGTTPSTSSTPPSTASPVTSSSTAAPTASTAPASTTPAGPTRCTTAALTGALTGSNGAAGSIYYSLVLTNHGSSACVMQGYPGVSFVAGTQGQQLGAPASRIPGSAPSFTVQPGSSGHAVLQITEAGNYGSGCQLTPVAGLRVYPPDQTTSLFIAHTDQGCANTSDVVLHIGALQP